MGTHLTLWEASEGSGVQTHTVNFSLGHINGSFSGWTLDSPEMSARTRRKAMRRQNSELGMLA